MGIRESINQRKALFTGIAIAAIVILLGYLMLKAGGRPEGSVGNGKVYYTDDDGATWFADVDGKLTPFDHNGKQAVKAYVFKCKGADAFVGYLERIPSNVHKAVADHAAGKIVPIPDDIEYKKPRTGDKGWVNSKADNVVDVKKFECPSGSTDMQPVYP